MGAQAMPPDLVARDSSRWGQAPEKDGEKVAFRGRGSPFSVPRW